MKFCLLLLTLGLILPVASYAAEFPSFAETKPLAEQVDVAAKNILDVT